MRTQVSICIATYRRPQGLARLLASLSRLKVPVDVEVEVVVVDNDAARSAEATARAHSELFERLQYQVEPRQNISHARNRAVEAARGRWLMFIDDDETADPNWLSAYWDFVDTHECDAAFGPVLPALERVVTPWLDTETFYTRPRQTTGAPVRTPRTSNAMVRASLFAERGFDPAYGRSGGEDSEFFGAMLRSGARMLWCDEASVTDFIPPERHNLHWLARRAFRGGFTHTRQSPAANAGRNSARAILALGAGLFLLPFASVGGRAQVTRIGLRCCTQAGHLWAAWGQSFEEYTDET